MARARNIKPGFFTNPELAECSPHARLLFIGLWLLADREGRLEDRPKHIKVHIFPCEDIDVDSLLGELHSREFAIRYEALGKRCIYIPGFMKHQNPHRNEVASDLPAFSAENSQLAARGERSNQIVSTPAESISISPILNPSPEGVPSKQTKASRRGTTTQIRLEQLLQNSGGFPAVEWGEWAHQQFGWDDKRISFEWSDFHDYWTSGNAKGGGLKSDWPATWRSHCRRFASDSRRGGGSSSGASGNLAAAMRSSFLARNGATQSGGSVSGGKAPAMPVLTAEEREIVCQSVKSLSDFLQPARERGPELEKAVGGLMAAMNVFTGDQAKLSLQVCEWCQYLEDYPL